MQLIVNFIEPMHGIIHDPACGTGMFVQTGYFVRRPVLRQAMAENNSYNIIFIEILNRKYQSKSLNV